MAKPQVRQLDLGGYATEHEKDSELIAYIVVGRAVVQWGVLEQNFNNLVARLFKTFGGSVQPPFALKRKIEFWNECFNKQERLAPWKKQAVAFSKGLVEAKKKRDILLHFAWEVDRSDITKPMKGRSLRADSDGGHTRQNMDLPLNAINTLVFNISNLNLSFMPIVFNLLSARAPKR
jgi:hypothetical protein